MGNSQFKKKSTKSILIGLVIIMLIQAVITSIPKALGSNYAMIGSRKALGSPILDEHFSIEDWNKWEMITWGVFLSNFPVPLLDDYESAFNQNSKTGSKGSGLQALRFGSGSDPANEETIKDLLNYAVTQQRGSGLKEIHVGFTDVKRGKIEGKTVDSGDDGGIEEGAAEDGSAQIDNVRQAYFKDMFIAEKKKDGDSWIKFENVTGKNNQTNNSVAIETSYTYEGLADHLNKPDNYANLTTINEGSIPTFYIKHGSGYEPVFDYTNGWDAQLLTAWLSRVATGDHAKEFGKIFEDMWEKSSDLKLYLDVFGNIVTEYDGSRRIIIPAAANQHLTSSPRINLVNSMIFNGYSSGLSGQEMVKRGQQDVSGWFGTNFSSAVRFGGLPALGSNLAKVPEGMVMLFYDLDTIVQNTYFNGGRLSTGEKKVEGESVEKVYGTHYGKAVKTLFDLDARRESGNEYIFKIEAANMGKFNQVGNKKAKKALQNMMRAGGQIANLTSTDVNAKILSEIKTTNGTENLFGEPVIIPVQMDQGYTDNSINSAGVGRMYANHIYQTYKHGSTSTAVDIDREFIETILTGGKAKTMAGLRGLVFGSESKTMPPLMANFISSNSEIYRPNVGANRLQGATLGTNIFGNVKDPFAKMHEVKVGNESITKTKIPAASADFFPGRLIKAYPISDVMKSVGNVLGIREGTDFAAYTPFIYMTYIDWYDLKINQSTGNATSNFNPRIFDGKNDVLNVDIEDITDLKSEEDRRKEILDYTYMLLHPTKGTDYRNEMARSYMNNFLYDNYQKIVYGNATSYYSKITTNLATRSASGFLSLDSFADNFMTSWVMQGYSKVALVAMAISIVAIIIVGLLRGRKFTWYLIAIAIVVNAILIVPSVGEITPIVANNAVQKIFSDKMTYWGISESVTNARLEQDYVEDTNISSGFLGELTKDEKARVTELVKTLNTVHLDRAIMIKSDISRKVTQTQSGNFAEIQKMRSARWMLPMIMRQFTANDESADYVYTPLADMYDDLSNLYWMYKPEDARRSQTVNGQQLEEGGDDDGDYSQENERAHVEEPITLANRKNYFLDYKNTTTKSDGYDIEYRSEAYYTGKTLDEMPHTYFYLLKKNANPIPRNQGFEGEYEGSKSIKKYVENSVKSGKAQAFTSAASDLEKIAGVYDRFDRSKMEQGYGYLWATENPFHYFYQSVKDSFGTDLTLGALVGKLQGRYTENDDGEEVRESFMHAGETGKVRDILDLEELFTNMVPYLYQMQLTAGGTNGKNGVLLDAKIEDYDIYSNNYKSWLFRSNWATKLMESPELTKKEIVRDKDGNRIEITNPILVDSYPDNRPMIFSEAQMLAEGLHEADLSLPELKAVEVNKEVAKKWTLLLNYANTPGMTKEVMLRQMATEGVTVFNSNYSPKGITTGSYAMYPSGLDLRAISFDTVMKMLMLNSTKDTNFIYGNTMRNIIIDSDMFSATLLLIAAFLCAYVIPLVRNITMGLIFFLGVVAIVYSLISSNKQKARTSVGYLITNILFLLMTLAYYLVFSGLMSVTTPDEVLTIQSVQVSSGNPVWSFIIIIIASGLYIYGMFKMIDFCYKNYRDMGYGVYTAVAGLAVMGAATKIGEAKDKVFGDGSGEFTGTSGDLGGETEGEGQASTGEGTTSSEEHEDDFSEYTEDGYDGYEDGIDEDGTGAEIDEHDIDEEIERGREMGNEEYDTDPGEDLYSGGEGEFIEDDFSDIDDEISIGEDIGEEDDFNDIDDIDDEF